MKIIFCLHNDIYCSYILDLLLPFIKHHKIRIILSHARLQGSLPPEIIALKNYEIAKKNIADFFGGEIFSYENINSTEAKSDITNFAPDLILSIRFEKIFREEIISMPKFGIINLHSGILPQYRGVMPTFWQILNGEAKIGSSLHYIEDRNIDKGAIIAVSKHEIKGKTFSANVMNLYDEGANLILDAVNKIEKGIAISTKVQSENEAQYFGYPKQEDVAEFLKIMPLF